MGPWLDVISAFIIDNRELADLSGVQRRSYEHTERWRPLNKSREEA